MFIALKVDSASFKHEGSIFIHHADQARATRTTIEPEHDGVVGGIFLGFEEDVVISSFVFFVEREIT